MKKQNVDSQLIAVNSARLQALRVAADYYGRVMERRGRSTPLDKRRPRL